MTNSQENWVTKSYYKYIAIKSFVFQENVFTLFSPYLCKVYKSIDNIICRSKFINGKASCLKRKGWKYKKINLNIEISWKWNIFLNNERRITWWYISAQNKTSNVYVEKNRRPGRSRSTISSACSRIIFGDSITK